MALDCLSDRLPVAQQAVRQGLATASLPGRFQVLPGIPTLVFDVAHNPQGAQGLAANLRQLMGEGRLRGVCGLLADKDAEGLVRPLTETVDAWYLARPDSPRGMSAERLAQRFLGAGVGRPLRVLPSVAAALDTARAQASPEDKVLVFGSFVTVGEAMRHLGMG